MMIKKLSLTLITLTLFLALWQFSHPFFSTLHFVLPSPKEVFLALIECKERFLSHSFATAKEILGGFLLASCTSFPLAWIMVRFKQTRSFLQPLFILIQSLPMFALAPLMVIWCGWGYTAVVLPTSLMIFFPLTLNIYQGLKSTPQSLVEFFQINGATDRQLLFKLRLPWALPHIFSGLRIAAGIAGMGAIAGEWAGAQKGLGILMIESRRNFDLEVTFGALFCLALLSTLLYGLILLTERLIHSRQTLIFRWPSLAHFSSYFTRKTTFAFSLLLIFLSTSSCHHPRAPHKPLLLLDWLPNHNHIPLYVGQEMGFFKEAGIDLQLQKMHESGGALSYLISDQVDLAIHHTPGALRAQTKGADLIVVGSLIQTALHALIYRSDSSITKPSDLTGKVLGYCIGGPDTSFLDLLLAKNDIVPKEKRNISVDIISALGTGNVDVIYGGFWNGEPHLLKNLCIETDYFTIEELQIPSYDEMVILSHKGSPYSESTFIKSFQDALQKSINFCKSEPERAFAIYVEHNPDKREKTLLWEEAAWKESYPLFTEKQELDLEKLTIFYEWQCKEGLLTHSIDPLSLVPH